MTKSSYMKKTILLFFITFFTLIPLLGFCLGNSEIVQERYRWRNNDGNETTATWKENVNIQTSLSSMNEILRLRLEISNNGLNTGTLNTTLQYNINNGTVWTDVSSTNAHFQFVTSTYVTNGAATTQHFPINFNTFYTGRIVSNNAQATQIIDYFESTEFEYVIQPTALVQTNATYRFRINNNQVTPTMYPTLVTTCIGTEILSHTNDTIVCKNQTIQLSATALPNNVINWYTTSQGGTPIQSGNTFSINNIIQNATYYVAASNPTIGCETPRIPININVATASNIQLGNDTTICINNGASYTINSGINISNINSVLWNTGANTSSINVAQTGTYILNVIDNNNCNVSDTIHVVINQNPILNLGNDTLICENSSHTLDAQNSNCSFIWNDGSQNQTSTVTQAGQYSVVVTSPENCTSRDTIEIAISPAPRTDGFNFIPSLNNDHGTVQFTTNNPEYVNSLKWNFGDGNVSTETNPIHQYTANGDYIVTLTVYNNCDSTDYTMAIHVDVTTGITKIESDNIKLNAYPNPAKEYYNIEIKDPSTFIETINVYNLLGQSTKSIQNINNQKINIDLNEFVNGQYIILIKTNKGNVVKKVIINK